MLLLACGMAAHLISLPPPTMDASVFVTCPSRAAHCVASDPARGDLRVCFDEDFPGEDDAPIGVQPESLRASAEACDVYVAAERKTQAQPGDVALPDGGDILNRFRTERRRTYGVYASDQTRLGTLEVDDVFGLDSARWALTQLGATLERVDKASLHILSGASSYSVWHGRGGAITADVFGDAQACEADADDACVAMPVDAALTDDTALMLSALLGMHLKHAH